MGSERALRRSGADGATPPHPSPRATTALQQRLLVWYADNGRDLPWRHTTDPYSILVSEVMLQQTQVSRVAGRYETFLGRFPTLISLAQAPLADVLRLWLGLGYNNRAVRLKRCAELAGERLPTSVDELERLPGLGPYTARALLVFAHNAHLAAVDANVRRVLIHELDLPPNLSPRDLQSVADNVLPAGRSRDWHNALMDYGALVLTSRATGLAPLSRQTPFEGSRRQLRARLLRCVVERDGAGMNELTTLLAIDRATVSGLVDDLVRDGLLSTEGSRVCPA